MKNALSLVVAMLVVLVAIPAFAADGNVPQATLSGLGLGGMQVMSDAEGMQVRGMSSMAAAGGRSWGFAIVSDPVTSDFAFGADTNGQYASAENGGASIASQANAGFQGSSGNVVFNGITATFNLGVAANAAAGQAHSIAW